jgi:ADP-heptose:LPS heptosyltransferase
VFRHLQIYDPRERVLVGLADAGLTVAAAVARLAPGRRKAAARAARAARAEGRPWPRRILLLRLERIGDLLMSAPAIAAVRQFAPDAEIDLVVGSWNAAIARLIPGIDRVETLDASWLARGRGGGAPGRRELRPPAGGGRARGYDLAINFEGDIRSHLLVALSGATERAGFTMAGGGPMLTRRFEFDPRQHTTANALRLVRETFAAVSANHETDPASAAPFRLQLPALARERAAALVGREPRVIALHASGGRAIKQWPPERFAAAAARVAREYDATLVLTGSPGDRPIVDEVRAKMPDDIAIIDLAGELELPILGAVLERCLVFITGDTGPMHLAAAVGTPTVAVFGLSDPARYAPISTRHRVVRIDLPCAPCNRVRLPPERCQGHTPDCLEGVTVDAVVRAALELRDESPSPPLPPLSRWERGGLNVAPTSGSNLHNRENNATDSRGLGAADNEASSEDGRQATQSGSRDAAADDSSARDGLGPEARR